VGRGDETGGDQDRPLTLTVTWPSDTQDRRSRLTCLIVCSSYIALSQSIGECLNRQGRMAFRAVIDEHIGVSMTNACLQFKR
jgi:hypothetical protein